MEKSARVKNFSFFGIFFFFFFLFIWGRMVTVALIQSIEVKWIPSLKTTLKINVPIMRKKRFQMEYPKPFLKKIV